MNVSTLRKPAAALPLQQGGASEPLVAVRRGENTGQREWSRKAQRWLRIISPFILLALWEAASRLGMLDARFFPPPSEIIFAARDGILNGSLISATVTSLRRLALGYAVGAAGGVVVGLWLGLSPWFRAAVEPWLQLTYPVPKLTLFPLLVLLVGFGETPIVILLAIAVFYIVAINTTAGVLSIRPVILDVGRDCGASFFQSFRTIALPAALPHIFTSLEIALGIGFIVLVAVEFIGAKTGLGAIIWSSWQTFDVAPMYVAIFMVSLCGYASALLLKSAGSLMMPWRKTN
ncbi:MAG TPA: ABC transporter permease [Xanthobacteraceae bacterium]|nr:ABC transporter permease [Xanthobacteraceae bacterium]